MAKKAKSAVLTEDGENAVLPTTSAAQLREIRSALGLSQEMMGAKMGTTRRTYWQWENEQREGGGSVARLAHILKALHEFGIEVKIDPKDPNKIGLIDMRN